MNLINTDYKLINVSYIDARFDSVQRLDALYIVNGKIASDPGGRPNFVELDCSNYLLMPGFVQTHVHLCQHLMKGIAEDVPLFEWLQEYILPYEMSHTEKSISLSARLALNELINGGTTTILDMGTFTNQEALFNEMAKSGIRAYSGNVLMDRKIGRYSNKLDDYIQEAEEWAVHYNNEENGPVFVLCPRFIPGMTVKGIRAIRRMQQKHNLLIHTHASETLNELEFSRKHFNMGNIEYMDKQGILNDRTVIAHAIHISAGELRLLKRRSASVAHCPSANMKLGSGIARISEMIERGINVTLGTDGAPCNNNHSQLTEMRHAGLLQKVKFGPASMKAREIFAMATISGALALGIGTLTGTIEEGKYADLIMMDITNPDMSTIQRNPFNAIVYSASSSDIKYVFAKGAMLKENGKNNIYESDSLLEERNDYLEHFLFNRF